MPVLDVRGTISSLASDTGPYTVTRYAPGDYEEGVHIPGATTTFEVVASVQPASGKELQRLPEGERVADTLVVFALSELRTRLDAAQADRIEIEGATYEVIHVEDWATEGGFWKALVRRVEEPSP